MAFSNPRKLISYANWFIKERIKTLNKDMNICLLADRNKSHAYIPALMECVSLLELFSGLYVGKLKYIGLCGIIDYSNKFLDSNIYTTDRLSVLYEMFRHKIAHLSQPYGVFDTHSVKNQLWQQQPKRLITWQVNATNRNPPIDIVPTAGTLVNRPPWPVGYTHKCTISIHRLKVDFSRSATGKRGYFEYLKADSQAQQNFETCMLEFFPK
jgi:hypothetical protein